MTITDGSAEQLNTATPSAPHDDLENWLQDLRTELDGDPPDWVANDPTGGPAGAARFEASRLAFLDNDEIKPPPVREPRPADVSRLAFLDNDEIKPPPAAREPKPVGRHRTPD